MACHYPLLAYPSDYQIFGHIHTLNDGTCYGVDGADQNNYTPISYWQLVDIFRNKNRNN